MRTKEQETALFQGLKPSDVAKALGCSTEHVLNLIRARKIAAINIAVGDRAEYRIERASFEAFLKERRVA